MRKLRDMLEDEGGCPTIDIPGLIGLIPQCGSFMVDFTACIPDWITCLTSLGGVLDAVADIADTWSAIVDTLGFCAGK